MRKLKFVFIPALFGLLCPFYMGAQGTAPSSSVENELIDAKGELMRLPPLKDLLRIAIQSAPTSRQIEISQEQARETQKLWKLSQFDVLTVQGVVLAGRRDVFSVNSDGTVFVPNATVVDNINTQGSVGIKVNPVSFLKSRRQVQINKLEVERLDVERDMVARQVSEGVIFAYNMAQKSLDLMDLRAEAMEAVSARAELAERLFRQGAMTLSEYTEFQSKSSDMTAKFHDARGDFRLYYHMLMERVYGKIP